MLRYLFLVFCISLLVFCAEKKEQTVIVAEETSSFSLSSYGKEKLSEYNFFEGELKNLKPNKNVVEYQLNSPLFSDYAFKKRFVSFPEGTHATFSADDMLDFPEGTVIIKNFYYPADFRNPDANIRLMETRLLSLENGKWKALPYIWNDEQTEAYLEVAGKTMDVSWVHYDGKKRSLNYSVPNANQCKGCHMRGDKIMPIGPTARQLNGPLVGKHDNQLEHWAEHGWLHGMPDISKVDKLANYEDETANLNDRARAWLETNCAHCHRPDGPAKTSGLHLLASTKSSYELGIGKTPVAAGRGSGGLKFDIVPGKPHESILFYRIDSDDPGIMMPELGRKLIHEEGVALIKQWIEGMKTDEKLSANF